MSERSERHEATVHDITRLQQIAEASVEVLSELRVLDSCRFGPARAIETQAAVLGDRLVALDALGPSSGFSSLSAIERTGDVNELALVEIVRQNLARIRTESASLSLELRKLLADTRSVISIATGSNGTYDAAGRTTQGEFRRTRALL